MGPGHIVHDVDVPPAVDKSGRVLQSHQSGRIRRARRPHDQYILRLRLIDQMISRTLCCRQGTRSIHRLCDSTVQRADVAQLHIVYRRIDRQVVNGARTHASQLAYDEQLVVGDGRPVQPDRPSQDEPERSGQPGRASQGEPERSGAARSSQAGRSRCDAGLSS